MAHPWEKHGITQDQWEAVCEICRQMEIAGIPNPGPDVLVSFALKPELSPGKVINLDHVPGTSHRDKSDSLRYQRARHDTRGS